MKRPLSTLSLASAIVLCFSADGLTQTDHNVADWMVLCRIFGLLRSGNLNLR